MAKMSINKDITIDAADAASRQGIYTDRFHASKTNWNVVKALADGPEILYDFSETMRTQKD